MQKHLFGAQEAFSALLIGEEKGLDFFFQHYYSPLVFFSQSLTGNGELAREIASEAFIKLWNNRNALPEPQKIKPFLYRIVRNASIDYLREQKIRSLHHQAIRRSAPLCDRTIMDALVESETHHRLYQLLSALPPRCRQVFHMFYFQDKALKEIAAELGISVNTVKTQKQRALQLLRENAASLSLSILASLLLF